MKKDQVRDDLIETVTRAKDHAELCVETLITENKELRVACAGYRAALELIATPKRKDGTYNRGREACEQLAKQSLYTDHGKEQLEALNNLCGPCYAKTKEAFGLCTN